MKTKSKQFNCADLPQPAVEAIRRYEAELGRMTGKKVILIAYEDTES